MAGLEQFGSDIWIASGPSVKSAGFTYPTRMVVIRLSDGGLFAWSPIALSAELRAAVDALGEVRFIVAPNALHHLFLTDWKSAYPRATLFAAPGSRARRKDIAFDEDLSDEPPSGWAGQIDQAIMHGNVITTEVVFFHRASGAVLFCDLLQNFPPGWFAGWRSLVARVDRMTGAEPQTPQKFRIAFTDRKAARSSLDKVMAWPADKVLMAHGDPVRENGKAFLRRAFRWLAKA